MFPDDTDPSTPPARNDVLAVLEQAMAVAREHITDSDPETPEKEELLIKWIRALAHLAGQYRMLKRDTDIDEIEDELELLQRADELEGGP